jgi:hypothetical protein
MCSQPSGDKYCGSLSSTSLPESRSACTAPFQVDRVPQYDGGYRQVETAGAVALVLETAVAGSRESGQDDKPPDRRNVEGL